MNEKSPPVIAALRACVGDAHVLTDDSDLAAYNNDWRGYYKGRALAVVRPATATEVAAVVKIAAAGAIGVVPQGGNTGLCGGATPSDDRTQIIVSMTRMKNVRAIDAENATMTVETGVTLGEAQQAAENAGFLFPVSLASEGTCQIGGNLSTNAGGTAVLRYGNMREQVLGLEVVLASGEVWNGLRGLRKDNTGYDLKQLFVGAEGTLGIVTAAVLKLRPLPKSAATALVAVRDPDAAVRLLGQLRRAFGDRLTGFEIMARICIDMVIQHMPGNVDALPGYDWYVLTQVDDTAAGIALDEALANALEPAMESGLVLDATIAQSEKQSQALWKLREDISEGQKPEGYSIKHDISLPVSAVPGFITRAEKALSDALPGARFVTFGHLGDGNLHYNLSVPVEAGPARERFLEGQSIANRIVHDLTAELAGSISAEHGLGKFKRDEVRLYKSALEIDLMKRIKVAFDPQGIMNPGKVL